MIHADEPSFVHIAERRPRKNGELRALLQALDRQMFLILAIFIALGAVAFVVVSLIPGKYESDAAVLVQPAANLADPNALSPQAPPEVVRSQLEVVQSQGVIASVVDQLGLMTDPEFAPSSALRHADASTRRAAVLFNVAKRLKVDNDGRSVTIYISFQANSPQKAARIADAIANAYIHTENALKNRAYKATQDRVDQRLADLRSQAQRSEEAADSYRRSAGLVWLNAASDGSEDLGGSTYSAKLLSQFSRPAADMAAAAAQADSKADQASVDMSRTGGADTPEVLSSAVISSLMARDAELANTESSLTARYTADHPLVLQVRAQRAVVERNLAIARRNIEQSLKLQANSAEEANHAANARATALEGVVNQQISKGVVYQQLQREAAIKQKVYEDFANKSGVISERSLLQLPDVVLVSPASLPIKESWPNRPLWFAMGCAFALILGCFAALLRELKASARV